MTSPSKGTRYRGSTPHLSKRSERSDCSSAVRSGCETVTLSIPSVAHPPLLGRIGGHRENHTREHGTAERCAPAARPDNDRVRPAVPVCGAVPHGACEVGEDVHDHQQSPDTET